MGFVVLHMPWEMTGVFWMGLLTLGTVVGCGVFLVRTAKKAARDNTLTQARQLDALEAVLSHAKQLGDRSKSLDDVAASYGEAFTAQLDAHAKSHQEATQAALEPLARRSGAQTVTAMQEHFRKVEQFLTSHHQTQQQFVESQQQFLAQMEAQTALATKERREADQQLQEGIAARADELLVAAKESAERSFGAVGALATEIKAAQREQGEQQLQLLEEQLQGLVERLDAGFSGLTGAIDRNIETGRNLDELLRERVNGQWEEVSERDAARAQELSELIRLVREDLNSSTDEARRALDNERERVMEREAAHSAREEALTRQLGHASEELSLAAVAQRETLGTLAEELRTRLSGVQETLGGRGEALLAAVQGQSEQQLAALEQIALRMESKGSGAMSELEAFVGQLSQAVERQRESQDVALAAFRSIDHAVVDAAERAASASLEQLLTRTHEVFDQQLELHEELLGRLETRASVEVMEEDVAMEEDVELLDGELDDELDDDGFEEPIDESREETAEPIKNEVAMDVVDVVVEQVPAVANAVA